MVKERVRMIKKPRAGIVDIKKEVEEGAVEEQRMRRLINKISLGL